MADYGGVIIGFTALSGSLYALGVSQIPIRFWYFAGGLLFGAVFMATDQ